MPLFPLFQNISQYYQYFWFLQSNSDTSKGNDKKDDYCHQSSQKVDPSGDAKSHTRHSPHSSLIAPPHPDCKSLGFLRSIKVSWTTTGTRLQQKPTLKDSWLQQTRKKMLLADAASVCRKRKIFPNQATRSMLRKEWEKGFKNPALLRANRYQPPRERKWP